MTLGDLIDAGRDLLLAETCVACQRSAVRGLCADCGASLVPRPMRVHPLRPPRGFPPTVAAGPYTAVLRSVVLGHKEQGQQSLAAPLGVVLAATTTCSHSRLMAGP